MNSNNNWAYAFYLVIGSARMQQVIRDIREQFLVGTEVEGVNFYHLTDPPQYRHLEDLESYFTYYEGVGDLTEFLYESEDMDDGIPDEWDDVLRPVSRISVIQEWEPVSDFHHWLRSHRIPWPNLVGGTGFIAADIISSAKEKVVRLCADLGGQDKLIETFAGSCRGVKDNNDPVVLVTAWLKAIFMASERSERKDQIFSLFCAGGW